MNSTKALAYLETCCLGAARLDLGDLANTLQQSACHCQSWDSKLDTRFPPRSHPTLALAQPVAVPDPALQELLTYYQHKKEDIMACASLPRHAEYITYTLHLENYRHTTGTRREAPLPVPPSLPTQ